MLSSLHDTSTDRVAGGEECLAGPGLPSSLLPTLNVDVVPRLTEPQNFPAGSDQRLLRAVGVACLLRVSVVFWRAVRLVCRFYDKY